MALVKIPTPLRRLTNEKDEVSTSSTSVESMITDLESQFPGIKDRLCDENGDCLLYTSPSPRDKRQSRMPSSA